jgi:alpha-galactosidase/6-phospho-beta-glucosidase family protein
MTRIAFIGAGSVVFTRNVLGDIFAYPELRGVELVLHDIDPGRLESAEGMARLVARERGAAPRITAHLDRRSAIEGADHVINMVQIGGHEATLKDFRIPARYGLRQTIADTLGIGGRACRRTRSRACRPGSTIRRSCCGTRGSLCPRLDERIADDPDLQRRVRVALHRRLGYYPTESSEHAAEYVPWFMHRDDQLERFRIPLDEYVRRSEANLLEYEHAREAIARGDTMALERSNEYAPTIIHAMETGEPAVIYGNVRNRDLLPGVPDDCCVEVPCLVDRTGVWPTPVPEYPSHLAAFNRPYVNVVEMTVRAVLEQRPDLVRVAAMLDPNAGATLSLDEIDAMCEELTAAHGDALPA